MTINITDPYYVEDIFANLEELRLITGKSNQEILMEALQEKYEHYRDMLRRCGE